MILSYIITFYPSHVIYTELKGLSESITSVINGLILIQLYQLEKSLKIVYFLNNFLLRNATGAIVF